MKTGDDRIVPIRIAAGPLAGAGPMWLPDNRSVLAFVIELERGGSAFYKIDTVTGETHLVRRFTRPPEATAVSPDGVALFYSTYNPDDRQTVGLLMRIEIATGQETQVKHGEWFASLAISPDGKELAYIGSDRPSSSGYIAIMSVDGSASREVFRSSAPWVATRSGTLSWTPDQKHLLFVRFGGADASVNAVWRVPSHGGVAEPVKGISIEGSIKNPELHPDGRRIFFSAAERSPREVWALEHFLPGVKAAK